MRLNRRLLLTVLLCTVGLLLWRAGRRSPVSHETAGSPVFHGPLLAATTWPDSSSGLRDGDVVVVTSKIVAKAAYVGRFKGKAQ